ncbi:MAG: GrpB family protein [Actinomycetota bacterium]|nr:GrpB family protein [Actinomycetota bacterium]
MTAQVTLDGRLRAAGVGPEAEPVDAWRRLRAVEGPRATMLDLYELAARRRGMAAHELPAEERHALAASVMPAVWPGWEPTSGSERPGDVIEVVDYDATWPDLYAAWRDVLVAALGATARRIEHIGSTAVPGLVAKPIIDVQVSVADLADEEAYVPALEAVGLQLRSRDGSHRYFRPFAGRPREIHVHFCEVGSAWEAEHLCFRDYLRANPDARDEYARAKRDAVAHWADDGWAYTDAKTEVVLDILARATRG